MPSIKSYSILGKLFGLGEYKVSHENAFHGSAAYALATIEVS